MTGRVTPTEPVELADRARLVIVIHVQCSLVGPRFVADGADSVLRINSQLAIHDGLIVESLAYSTLQAGPEFAAWLATRPSPRLGLGTRVECRTAFLWRGLEDARSDA